MPASTARVDRANAADELGQVVRERGRFAGILVYGR
jgi:hypothetical protein